MTEKALGCGLFDRSEEYDAMLHRGLKFSGEKKAFFAEGRVLHMRDRLPAGLAVRKVLDFGCGIGDTTRFLAETFPGAEVTGTDTAREALAFAAKRNGSSRVSFAAPDELKAGEYDLCYSNGVFHHVAPSERPALVRAVKNALAPGGRFAFFENNPLNPGTRLVMKFIPFDRGAVMLSIGEASRLLLGEGFSRLEPAQTLFYFPRALSFLRFSERLLGRVPLGAQYCVIAVK